MVDTKRVELHWQSVPTVSKCVCAFLRMSLQASPACLRVLNFQGTQTFSADDWKKVVISHKFTFVDSSIHFKERLQGLAGANGRAGGVGGVVDGGKNNGPVFWRLFAMASIILSVQSWWNGMQGKLFLSAGFVTIVLLALASFSDHKEDDFS